MGTKKRMHVPPPVPPEARAAQLSEVDRQILENTLDLVNRVHRKAGAGEITVMAEFVRTLFGHRETILRELEREGISEAEAYKMMRG